MARRDAMSPEPRHESDYTARQVEAARRVLIDIGQVLASFRDSVVVVGGWVPDFLLPEAEPEHIGSIDVDLALDAASLGGANLFNNLQPSRKQPRGTLPRYCQMLAPESPDFGHDCRPG